NLLVLDGNSTHAVPPRLVYPDARDDVLDRIDDVLVPVVAGGAVGLLRGIADDRHGGVDQQVEPVDRLFDVRAPLQPDGPPVLPPRQGMLYRIGHPSYSRARRLVKEPQGPVGKEVHTKGLRWDVATPYICPLGDRQSLRVAPGRGSPIERKVGPGGEQI